MLVIRLIKAILFDSPLSRAGCLFATVVACAIGFPLSTGRVRVERGLIIFSGMPEWSFGRGGTCVGSVYLTNRSLSDPVLKHERIHVTQWKRYGLLMPLLYWLAGKDPLTNRFEVEAGLRDGGYQR